MKAHASDRDAITVVGVDPGLAHLGLGAVREERRRTRCLGFRLVRTDSRQSLPDRLSRIYDGVSDFLLEHRPDALAIEGQFFHRQREAAFKVGQAVGVVLLAAERLAVPVHEYGPMQVKQALVGTGRATKDQVVFMVRGMLELSSAPESHHVSDALALALTHLGSRRVGALVPGRER